MSNDFFYATEEQWDTIWGEIDLARMARDNSSSDIGNDFREGYASLLEALVCRCVTPSIAARNAALNLEERPDSQAHQTAGEVAAIRYIDRLSGAPRRTSLDRMTARLPAIGGQ